ncbi:hypothetical protein TNCV_2025621 [Trichonephila clavipes]|nr:hypothetical protein TNCV_2025621 [Trichonephila clavipes]
MLSLRSNQGKKSKTSSVIGTGKERINTLLSPNLLSADFERLLIPLGMKWDRIFFQKEWNSRLKAKKGVRSGGVFRKFITSETKPSAVGI